MMKAYESSIESGIEWLNKVPSHWVKSRLRYLCDITTGNKDTINRDDEGQYPFFVRSKTIERISTFSYDGEAILTAGDGDICKIWHHVDEKFDFHQRVYMLYNFKQLHGRFLYYYISENFYHDVFKLSAKNTVDSLRLPMFLNFPVLVPPIIEQTQIARYLDYQTSIIDQLIQQKEKLIELLKEKRQAVINEAVTQGLNPNAKMKDSGIEWLGEVPEEWIITPFRFLADKIGSGVTPKGGAEVYTEQGVVFIRSQNVHFNGLRLDDVAKIEYETHEKMSGSKVKIKDVLLNITGASIGRCCVVNIQDEMNVNQHVCIIRPILDKIISEYLNLVLQSDIGQTQIRMELTGGNRDGLTFEALKAFILPLPNLKTQLEIVQEISFKTNQLLVLETNISLQIEKLKEYRQSIISEAVTGKIDVRDWQPNKQEVA